MVIFIFIKVFIVVHEEESLLMKDNIHKIFIKGRRFNTIYTIFLVTICLGYIYNLKMKISIFQSISKTHKLSTTQNMKCGFLYNLIISESSLLAYITF